MKRRRKENLLQRMTAVLLSAVLVVGMISGTSPLTVFAEENAETRDGVSGNDAAPETVAETSAMRMAAPVALADNIASGTDWVLDADGKLTISSDAGMTDRRWKDNSTAVISVEIQNGVTSIGEGAFNGCSNLASITIPGTVTSIGGAAFTACGSLESIEIPSGVTSIGASAFSGCSGLESVTMKGETPPTLGSRVFSGCKCVQNYNKGIHVPSGKAETYKAAAGWNYYTNNITDGTHEHKWASDWTKDETYHWHECTASGCTVTDDTGKEGYGAHVYDNDSDTDCNTCGYERTLEITGISVELDLTSVRAAQVGDKFETPFPSITFSPDVMWEISEWWQRKEDDGFTRYEGSKWEEGIYVYEIRVRVAYVGAIFAAEPQITSLNGEHWTVVERSSDNRTIVLRSDEIVKATHTHEYGGWQHDSTQHWKTCTCGDETGRANHDFGDWITDREATASKTGTKHRDCRTCGYREAGTIPATGTEPGNGTVTPEVKPGANAPAMNISTPAAELEDMLLTDEEKRLVQSGTNIRIVLEVQDAGNTVSDSDKNGIQQALNGFTVGQYLNIDLYKLTGENRTDITETAKKIRIVIAIPDSLKNVDSKKTRTFAVVRIHDGKAELLSDLDNSADTITIETDRFSTYAIVYKDAPNAGGSNDQGNKDNHDNGGNGSNSSTASGNNGANPSQKKDNEPKTGDSTPLELYATLAMIAGFTYLLLYFSDGRRGMTEEKKKELVSRLVAWAKQGGKARRLLALSAIFVLLVYYHSIGKKIAVEWAKAV